MGVARGVGKGPTRSLRKRECSVPLGPEPFLQEEMFCLSKPNILLWKKPPQIEIPGALFSCIYWHMMSRKGKRSGTLIMFWYFLTT